jgi:hypothetical protein
MDELKEILQLLREGIEVNQDTLVKLEKRIARLEELPRRRRGIQCFNCYDNGCEWCIGK